MKYATDFVVKTLKDEPYKGDDGAVADIKYILAQALLADNDGAGQPIRGADKSRRFDLYMKIKASKDVIELTSDEVGLCIAASEIYPTLIYGQVRNYLEQKD